MKTIHFFLLSSFIGILCGCSNDSGNGGAVEAVTDILKSGTWRVTYFFKSSQDKTASYTGYVFTFYSVGTLTAVHDSIDELGVWSPIERDDNDNCDLVISFITQNVVSELSNNWHVIDFSDLLIRMADEAGTTGPEYLTIEKN